MLRLPVFARIRAPLLVFAVCAAVYVATLGARVRGPSDNVHFVSLAESYLHGSLAVLSERPPGENDWAQYKGRWFVVFPPFPALMIMPAVAIWHGAVWDRLYWALFAGLGPALLFVLLRRLREREHSGRTAREDLALTALFAFGSAFYYTAVQGTVWFAAHVVAVPLTALFVLFSLNAERPMAAGLVLGLSWLTRASTPFLAPLFLVEALAVARSAPFSPNPIRGPIATACSFVGTADLRRLARLLVLFALPLLGIFAVSSVLNYLRFDDPFEVGYRFLRIRWAGRIEKWGLVNYHYFAKNLAVFLTALPWLSGEFPFVRISRHGLALWVTTPAYAWVLWPKRVNARIVGLSLAAACVAVVDLCYQNSGWIQFAYRFSLDYSVLLIALLALGGRRFGWGFYALLVLSIAINSFGALTFDRNQRFYDQDGSQNVIFQPD